MEILYKILGAIGLVFITAGVLTKDRRKANLFFIFGGLLLLIYSASIRDPIFVPLQLIFVLAAFYELLKLEKKSK